jgi:hypothetical protein
MLQTVTIAEDNAKTCQKDLWIAVKEDETSLKAWQKIEISLFSSSDIYKPYRLPIQIFFCREDPFA